MLLDVLRHVSEATLPPMHVVFWLLIASGCCVVVTGGRTQIAAWATVVLCSVVWLRVDQHDEGRILLVFSPSHGFVEADLLVPVVVCTAAAASGVLGLRQRKTGETRGARQRTHRRRG
jgi:uncharacterized membrane protein YphA (DoxX/SURF4 family)